MPRYSKRSIQRIEECHENLQLIAYELIHRMDVIVLCGHRGEREQNAAYDRGNSKLRYPRSKHNSLPSRAIDIAPYTPGIIVDWKDLKKFAIMCDHIKHIADQLGIKIRQGRYFSFHDWPHTEIV